MESYRSVLEVFKFVSPLEVLQNAGRVSNVFRRAGDSDELWIHFILIESPKFAFPPGNQSCKSRYITEFFKEIIHLTATQLTVFLLPVYIHAARKLDKLLLIDESCAYGRLPDGRVLVCPGLSNISYLINARTGHVTDSPSMLVERRYTGLLCIEHFAYAFGGLREGVELRRVEKLSLIEGAWKDAPKTIFPHAKFNPCRQITSIYLLGHAGNEVFRVKSEAYTPLMLILPVHSEGNIAIAFNQSIIVLSHSKIHKVALQRDVQVTDSCTANKKCYRTCTTPVAIGSDAYFFVDGSLWKLEGNTMTLRNVS